RWDGPLDAPLHYRAQGLLSGLSLAAQPSSEPGGVGRPGLRNATVELDATEAGGSARLGIANGVLDLPGVFDDPLLPLDQFSAQLLWKIEPAPVADQPPKITVQVKNAQFANPDAKGELSATWSPGAGAGVARGGRYPGRLELDGKLSDAQAARTYRYLPLGISRETREYVQHAIQGGKLASASFRVKGDLWDFPFYNAKSNKDGEFRITAKIADAQYAFVPSTPASGGNAGYASPWPVLAKVDVDLALDRGTLALSNGRAQFGNLEFRGVQGAIRNLETEGLLTLDASARGPLAEMLRVVATTPIGGWIGKALDNSTGSGNAELKLNLGIPLDHVDKAT
ncbi:MAG: DUF3971 domain-containing protein, partial [Rhizobacter sp.]